MDRAVLAMIVLATYDITHDDRRSRLAALLQSCGNRIQKSVFLLDIPADEMVVIRSRSAAIIDLERDSLYFFRQCSNCWEVLDCVGQADPPRRVLYWSAW